MFRDKTRYNANMNAWRAHSLFIMSDICLFTMWRYLTYSLFTMSESRSFFLQCQRRKRLFTMFRRIFFYYVGIQPFLSYRRILFLLCQKSKRMFLMMSEPVRNKSFLCAAVIKTLTKGLQQHLKPPKPPIYVVCE